MKRKYLENLAYRILFLEKFYEKDSIQKNIILPLIAIVAFNYSLYSQWGGFASPWTDTICAFIALFLWLTSTPQQAFKIGLGVGIGWFWWISLSFRYYDLSALIPIVILFIGGVYGVLFYLLARLKNIFLKALMIVFAFDVVTPFGFDWFHPEILLIDTPFGGSKLTFGMIVFALALLNAKPQRIITFFSIVLIGSSIFFIPSYPTRTPPFSIFVASTHINQALLWDESFKETISENSLSLIDHAILRHHDLVILPESAFPFLLDHSPELIQSLQEKSHHIAIVAGSLSFDESTRSLYNSAYYFIDGNVTIASKHVLVPFGEEIPLPDFAKEWLNSHIFDGASDYATASTLSDVVIKNTPFRNAICYEATCDVLYKNDPHFMIAMSNNGWFLPSFQPLLQRKLLTLHAKYHGTTIYHAVNGSQSYIITP